MSGLRRFAKRLGQLNNFLLPLPVNLLAALIPKKRGLWVFGAWGGKTFTDNCKYFFLYVSRQPGVEAIWLARSLHVIKEIRSTGLRAYPTYSWKGFWCCLRAEAAFYSTNYVNDLNRFGLSRRTRLVNLWHGIPLKRLLEAELPADQDLFGPDDRYFWLNAPTTRLLEAWKSAKKNRLAKLAALTLRLARWLCLAPKPSLAIAAGEHDRDIFNRAFAPTVITGYPRDDVFAGKTPDDEPNQSQKRILYLPTFRGGGRDVAPFNPFSHGFEADAVDAWLEQRQATLTIKLHPNDLTRLSPEYPALHLRHIRLLTKEAANVDLYQMLRETDILMTDYSSIYFDFLLTGRPMVFAPFDLEAYRDRDRGFYFDYDEVTPGPKARSWGEILKYLDEYLKNPQKDADWRRRVRDRFHQFQDGRSSERVYREVMKLLGRSNALD